MAARGGASDVLSFEIEGERQFRFSIGRMVHALGDMRPFWEGALKPSFYAVEAQQFASQGADGRSGAWAQLSPQYAAWKATHYPGRAILQRSGALMASLLGGAGHIFQSAPSWMAIGSGLGYGIYHQTGAGNLPRRRPIDISGEQEKRIVAPAFGLIARELGMMWQSGSPLSSVRGGG